jgi:hypothetical protein
MAQELYNGNGSCSDGTGNSANYNKTTTPNIVVSGTTIAVPLPNTFTLPSLGTIASYLKLAATVLTPLVIWWNTPIVCDDGWDEYMQEKSKNKGADVGDEYSVVVDPQGNAIPLKPGQKVEGNKDGTMWQVKDENGNPTGDGYDGKGHPKQEDRGCLYDDRLCFCHERRLPPATIKTDSGRG